MYYSYVIPSQDAQELGDDSPAELAVFQLDVFVKIPVSNRDPEIDMDLIVAELQGIFQIGRINQGDTSFMIETRIPKQAFAEDGYYMGGLRVTGSYFANCD